MSQQFTPEEVRKLKQIIGSPVSTKKTTHVIQVLDESSSMETGQDVTISSYNEMQDIAKKQHSDENEITFTLVKFSDHASISSIRVPAGNAIGLNTTNYKPHGLTALYDAIGLAIQTARNFPSDDNTAYLLQIFTDGGENASTSYRDPRTLKAMIAELQATGKWTVTVAGPKGQIDLFTQYFDIPKGNTTTFDPTSYQSRTSNAGMMVGSTANYFAMRGAGGQSMTNAYSSVKDVLDQADNDPLNPSVSFGALPPDSSLIGQTAEQLAQKAQASAAWPFPTTKSHGPNSNTVEGTTTT